MSRLGPLTERESEIVLLLADGHRGVSVARQLGISAETIRRHTSNIMNKLGTNSANDVIAWYYKTFWMPNPNAPSTPKDTSCSSPLL